MGVTLSKKRVIHGCLDIQHVLVPGDRQPAKSPRRGSVSGKHVHAGHGDVHGKKHESLPGWSSPLKWGSPAIDWSPPFSRPDHKVPIKEENGTITLIAQVDASFSDCEQCLHAQGSFGSMMSSDSVHMEDDSSGSLEHTRTVDCWNGRADCEPLARNHYCLACSRPEHAAIVFDENEESTVVQIHASISYEERNVNEYAAKNNEPDNDDAIEIRETIPERSLVGSPTTTQGTVERDFGREDAADELDGLRMTERASRRHQSLPAVDVEPTIQWRRCQTRRTSAPRLGYAGSESAARPDRLRSRHQPARELRLVRVDPVARATGDANSIAATRRHDSAPEISDIGRRIVICLTSVDGRELSLVSPRYGEHNCDPPVCRCATRRPFSSPLDHLHVASGPKGSSKDDSSFNYTPTANGDYTGPETLTIMRRSSSKRRSRATGTPTPEAIGELDDTALEQQVDVIDDEPLLASATMPSMEVCENAALRLKCLLRLLEKGQVRPEVIQKNLKLAIQVLDSVYLDEAGSPEAGDSSATPSPVSSPCPPEFDQNPSNSSCPSSLPQALPRLLVTRPAPVPGAIAQTDATSSNTVNASSTLSPTDASSLHSSSTTIVKISTHPRRIHAPLRKRRTPDEEDDLSEVRADAVPPEVRAWLASTFTRQVSSHRKPGEDKPKFRSVAQAIRAGILVERIYRRMSSSSFLQFPAEVARNLKLIDEWSFDVFGLNDASGGSPLRYLGIDLLNRYGVIHKFKIPNNTLEAFLTQTEIGYCKHRNLYHNNTHAADVAQTLHYILYQTGLMNWLTDLEIFAAVFAAIIHDFEHTGTTNNFHVMSGSEAALLYNDRAVQENHHISAAFRLMKDEECNILVNLSREEYREFRSLVIDMVLATDMSCHFQQIKAAKSLLSVTELSVDKSKILSLVLHCCDVAHPSKPWPLHRHWTDLLLEEFFRQGDHEKELGLPYSPLCDRNTTLVAESQIGFIEFIVEPSMTVMGDLLDKILIPLRPQSSPSRQGRDSISEEKTDTAVAERSCSAASTDRERKTTEADCSKSPLTVDKIFRPWDAHLEENKSKWKELSVKDQQRRQEEAKGAHVEE